MEQPKQPEVLDDIVNAVKSSIKKTIDTEISTTASEYIAENVAKQICHQWGGLTVYIPKGIYYQTSNRNIEIYKKFTGKNHIKLAREYGLSVQQIYSIIKTVYEAEKKRTQLNMFES